MNQTPEEKWNALSKEILKKIKEIDKEVPYSDVPPDWWNEMFSVFDEIKHGSLWQKIEKIKKKQGYYLEINKVI